MRRNGQRIVRRSWCCTPVRCVGLRVVEAAVGPSTAGHEKVYLTSILSGVERQIFGAGDSRAYVIAHESGIHIQKLRGNGQVTAMRERLAARRKCASSA